MAAAVGLQRYLERAVGVLEHLGITRPEGVESRLAQLLEEVRTVDEPKVLAIAKVVQEIGRFSQAVRDEIGYIKIGDRYNDIKEAFDSIRDDSRMLLEQIADGRIDFKEKMQNAVMKITRGNPHKRFEKIARTYEEVSRDTKDHLDREQRIMMAYMDFRFAMKEGEIVAHELLQKQEQTREERKMAWEQATSAAQSYQGQVQAEKSTLELTRDEALRAYQEEDRRYQLLKDVAENLTIGYNVGETLVIKLKQTHDIKEQVYRMAVTFFGTNEHVFSILAAVYASQHGLHEATQTLEAMKEGTSKSIEDVADLGSELEKAAMQAGYGPTITAQSVQKLVDAIVKYQTESGEQIEQLRRASTENSQAIATIVEDGKRRFKEAVVRYTQPAPQLPQPAGELPPPTA